jgi:nitrous oxide reductase accessory protein NosL
VKTHKILLAISVVSVLLVSGCSSQGSKTEAGQTQATAEKVNYTCPMHPEVITEYPGKCPKCGMELVKMEKPSDSTSMMHDTMHNMNIN